MITSRIKNGWLKKIVENVKAMPAYVGKKVSDAWNPPNQRKAMELETKYGPTLRNDQYYNELIRTVKTKLDAGDEIGAIAHIKEKARRLREQQSQNKY